MKDRPAIRITRFTIPGPPVGYLRMTQGQVKLMRIPRHKLTPQSVKVQTAYSAILITKSWPRSVGFG